jgi:SecD/SecF fusion protein
MPPIVAFLIALSLFALFILYFATDSDFRQRIIGTILALGLAGFCAYSLFPPEEKIKRGMDLAGGVRFTLQLNKRAEATEAISKKDQEEALNVLQKRLAGSVSDVSIAPEGDDRLVVDIPHRDGDANQKIDDDKIKQIRAQLQKSAILELYLTHEQNNPVTIGKIERGEDVIPFSKIATFAQPEGESSQEPEKLLLKDEVMIEGKDVTNAYAFNESGSWKINITFVGDGEKTLSQVSKKYAGDGVTQMAILLDGEIISAAVFNGHIPGGNCQITGRFTEQEANTLSVSMRNPLGVKPEILYEESFPPTLANEAINQGIRAGLSGLLLTALFMAIFYRFAGLIALIGLSMNIILLFGILAIFQADFTLAGIAGVILTIGIAIDANVLIYERLREEMAAGKTIGIAIQTAYEKAFSAIFDAQITTLITALVLLWLAEGAIQGFAVTLTIGIIVSLFSALLVTRVSFNWLGAARKLNKPLTFTPVLSNKKINFLGLSKFSRFISVALIGVTVLTIGLKKEESLGIEFVGGDQLRFNASENTDRDSISKVITDTLSETKKPQIQELTPIGGDSTIFSVRIEPGSGEKVKQAIATAGLAEGQIQSQQIGSVVAGEMLQRSLYALIAGLGVIFIYVTFRFEFSFAIGAIAALIHDLLIVIGITVLCGKELNLILVGAFLTIAGYSINDTIVVFDRIRENLRSQRGNVKDIMNIAINATLSRTILTSLTTLITVVCLLLFGGPALNDFSFAIVIGVIVGTYSSIFVASPIVYWWAKKKKVNLRRQILDADQDDISSTATTN